MQMHKGGQFDFGYFSFPNTADTQVDPRCLGSLGESSLELMNTHPDNYSPNGLHGPYKTWKNFQNSPEDSGFYCFGNVNGLEPSTMMHPAFPMVIPEPKESLQAADNPDNPDNSGGFTEEASRERKSNDAQTQSRRRRVCKVKSAERELSRLTKLASDLQMKNKQLKMKISLLETALPKADALIELMLFMKTQDLRAQNTTALVGPEPVSCLKNLRLSIFTPLSHEWPNYEELKAIERLTSEEFCAIYSKLIMECSLAIAHDALREKCGYPHAPTSTALLCAEEAPASAQESRRRFPLVIPHYSVLLNFVCKVSSLNPDAICLARSRNLHTNIIEEPGEEFWDAVLGNLDLTEEQVSHGIAASTYALERLEKQDPHRNDLIRQIRDKLYSVCRTNNCALLPMGSETCFPCAGSASGDHTASSSSSAKSTAASAAQPPFGNRTSEGFFHNREKTPCDATPGEETKGCCAGGRGSSMYSQRGPYITHSPGYRGGTVGHDSLIWDRWTVSDGTPQSHPGDSVPGESGFPLPAQASSSTTLGADVAADRHHRPAFSSGLPPKFGSVGVGSGSAARPDADLSSSASSAAKYYAARHGGDGLRTGPGEALASAGSSGISSNRCAPPGGFVDPGSDHPLVVLGEVHQLAESVRSKFSRQHHTDMLTTEFLLSNSLTTQQAIRFFISVYPLVPDLLSICKAFQRLNLTEDRKRRL